MQALRILFILTLLSTSLLSQESDFESVIAPSNGNCGNPLVYKVSVSNVGESSLINTGIIIEVFNDQNQVEYTDTVAGPNISASTTHQYDIIIPPGGLEFNGQYQSRFTFFATTDLNSNNTTPFFPLSLSFCAMRIEEAITKMSAYIEGNIDYGERQVGYIYPSKIEENTSIRSYFAEEFDMIFNSDIYLGFVASDMSSLFEQPGQLLIMNAQFGFVSPYDVNWFPVINDIPWNPLPFGDIQISGLQFEPIAPPLLEFLPEEPSPDTNVCAILIGGTDPNDTLQRSFDTDVDIMKEHLMNGKFGPKLSADQIVVRKRISGDSVRSEISKLDEGYDKIYFYYYGHGSKSGKMCTGSSPEEWLEYEDFFDELYTTRASKFCIFLDCCFAGTAINAAESHVGTLFSDVEIVTGANDKKTGTASYYWENNMWVAHGTMSRNLLLCSNDEQADADSNEQVSWPEAYNWVVAQNPIIPGPDTVRIVERQCPDTLINKYDPQAMKDLWLDHIMANYPAEAINRSEIYLHENVLRLEDVVESFDGSFSYTPPGNFHFGWVNWEANASFEKEVTFGFIDPITNEIEVFDDIPFWPIIPGYDDYNAYDIEDLVYIGANSTTDEVPEDIFTPIEEPAPQKDSICAVLVSGTDERTRYRDRYVENVNFFKGNLLREKFGPQLNEENILVQHGIGKDSILSIFEEMQNKYKKVYFYYSGHGNRESIACGVSSEDWLEYRELLAALDEINAGNYCIFLDNCYSGNIVCEQKLNQFIDPPKVEIYTSANKNKYSYGNSHTGGSTIGYSVFTFNFLLCFGDPAADKNGDQVTSFKESFDWFIKQNPEDTEGDKIVPLQCPMHYIKQEMKKSGNDVGTQNATGTDFSIRQRNRSISSYNLDVVSYFEILNRQFEDEDIFKISPNRYWHISGELSPDSSQAFDYIFQYDEGLDSLSAQMV